MSRRQCINGCGPKYRRVGKWCFACYREIRRHELEQLLHPWMRDGGEERLELERRGRDDYELERRRRRREMLERAGFKLVAA